MEHLTKVFMVLMHNELNKKKRNAHFLRKKVLIQNRHLIAFMSCRLYDTKMLYMVQEKKMTSIIHCLRT
ncbi:hypothetical protein AAG906_032998 [Vitis piasezkii]